MARLQRSFSEPKAPSPRLASITNRRVEEAVMGRSEGAGGGDTRDVWVARLVWSWKGDPFGFRPGPVIPQGGRDGTFREAQLRGPLRHGGGDGARGGRRWIRSERPGHSARGRQAPIVAEHRRGGSLGRGQ